MGSRGAGSRVKADDASGSVDDRDDGSALSEALAPAIAVMPGGAHMLRLDYEIE